MTLSELADEYGRDRSTVRRWLDETGIHAKVFDRNERLAQGEAAAHHMVTLANAWVFVLPPLDDAAN